MIFVLGLGFVGLTTAVGLASKGNKICGIEINKKRFQNISKNKIPFYEPGLKKAYKKLKNKNLEILNNLSLIKDVNNVFFICVGTPQSKNGSVNLTDVKETMKNIIKNIPINSKALIVIKSTCPPKTIDKDLIPLVSNIKYKNKIRLLSNPEFLREGTAYEDFINADRIVLGSCNREDIKIMKKIYRNFNSEIIVTSPSTAEFIKYLSNSFLSNVISFSNEMMMLGEKIGNIDINKSFKVLHKDKRWFGKPAGMHKYVLPGIGFGGYCLPKDIKALMKKSKDYNVKMKALEATIKINNEVMTHHLQKILKKFKKNDPICILGLSFKANSDDVRESRSFILIEKLIKKNYKKIYAYDPIATDNYKKVYNQKISFVYNFNNFNKIYKKMNYVKVINWKEFNKLNIDKNFLIDLVYKS